MSNIKGWLIVLVALLDDFAALVLVLIVLWFFHVRISLPAVIILVLVLGSIIFLIHRAVVPAVRRTILTGSEGMVGLECTVIEQLCPFGTVQVKGEYWRAESVAGMVAAGETVEVLGMTHLTLTVRLKGKVE